MNDKHNEIQQWLDSIFGSEAVPCYEINPTTIDCLFQMMKKNQRQDKAAALIIEDLHEKSTEYASEMDRFCNNLSCVGLSTTSLSQSGAVSLSTLVNTALCLRASDASETSLMLAMSEESQSAAKLVEARKLEQKLLSQLILKTKTALLKVTALQKALTSIEAQAEKQEPELENKAKQAAFLQSKAKEYRKHIQQQQKDLNACGVDPSLYHGTLVRRAEDLQQLRDQLHPLRAKLESYQKLPPDLALARVKIEEARMELNSLEEKLGSQIDMMHM